MAFVIIDLDSGSCRPYVARSYATEREAEGELAGLLRIYPSNHEWRQRLVVRQIADEDFHVVKSTGRRRHRRDVVEEPLVVVDVEGQVDDVR